MIGTWIPRVILFVSTTVYMFALNSVLSAFHPKKISPMLIICSNGAHKLVTAEFSTCGISNFRPLTVSLVDSYWFQISPSAPSSSPSFRPCILRWRGLRSCSLHKCLYYRLRRTCERITSRFSRSGKKVLQVIYPLLEELILKCFCMDGHLRLMMSLFQMEQTKKRLSRHRLKRTRPFLA